MVAKAKKEENGKDFWVRMGRELGETKACGEHIKEEFHKFMTNDHVHLCAKVDSLDEKVDRLAVRLAAIVGGITALSAVIQYLIK